MELSGKEFIITEILKENKGFRSKPDIAANKLSIRNRQEVGLPSNESPLGTPTDCGFFSY